MYLQGESAKIMSRFQVHLFWNFVPVFLAKVLRSLGFARKPVAIVPLYVLMIRKLLRHCPHLSYSGVSAPVAVCRHIVL